MTDYVASFRALYKAGFPPEQVATQVRSYMADVVQYLPKADPDRIEAIKQCTDFLREIDNPHA